jgi:death-on-curing protein
MEVFLVRNGHELDADVNAQEQVLLDVAAGEMTRDEPAAWVEEHAVARAA